MPNIHEAIDEHLKDMGLDVEALVNEMVAEGWLEINDEIQDSGDGEREIQNTDEDVVF